MLVVVVVVVPGAWKCGDARATSRDAWDVRRGTLPRVITRGVPTRGRERITGADKIWRRRPLVVRWCSWPSRTGWRRSTGRTGGDFFIDGCDVFWVCDVCVRSPVVDDARETPAGRGMVKWRGLEARRDATRGRRGGRRRRRRTRWTMDREIEGGGDGVRAGGEIGRERARGVVV